jgi:hypothetical protein
MYLLVEDAALAENVPWKGLLITSQLLYAGFLLQ